MGDWQRLKYRGRVAAGFLQSSRNVASAISRLCGSKGLYFSGNNTTDLLFGADASIMARQLSRPPHGCPIIHSTVVVVFSLHCTPWVDPGLRLERHQKATRPVRALIAAGFATF
jgi:hypothetical protein